MRIRFSLLAAAVVSLAAFAGARGEEPHLDLIRGLRAQGEPGLAMEYLQERLTNPPEALKAVLALEAARTRVDLALLESEEGKRVAMLTTARGEFEAFLKNNPGHPLAPQAGLEIARLVASQGKEHLNRGLKQENDPPAAKISMEAARPLFTDASTKLQAAAAAIKAQLDKVPNPATPEERAIVRELQQAYLQAQLEEGINLFQLGRTHGNDLPKRGEAVYQAIKVLEKLSEVDVKHPMSWVARAWLGRCHIDVQDFRKAQEAFDAIRGERGTFVDTAKRLAGYFELLLMREEKKPLDVQEATANRWINSYRSYLKTAEGFGVRYFLAQLLEAQAEAGITRDKSNRPTAVRADSDARLARAERLYRELTETDNDYSERAAGKRMRVILGLAIRRAADRDVTKLKDFEKCYMIAQLELAELNETVADLVKTAPDDLPDQMIAVRKEKFEKVLTAIDRALTLTTPKDPPKEVEDARNIQVFANLTLGRNKTAAALGEQLAKTMVKKSRGAAVALYALQAHRNTLNNLVSGGDTDARAAEIKSARDEVRRIARFMEDTWPNDTPTDSARHQLGQMLASEGDHLGALQAFARVTPNYANLAFLRNEQGASCFHLQRAKDDGKTITAPVKQQWFARITGELEKMPDLGAGAEADVATAYCYARLQLGNLYRLQAPNYAKAEEAIANYARVETIAKSVLEQMKNYTALVDKARTDLTNQAHVLRLSGLYGQIYQKVKANDPEGAKALYQPFVDDMKKNGVPKEEEALRVRESMASVLQLALRNTVQMGQIEQAQELLKLLESASAGQSGASAPLVQVLREVKSQIDDLKKNNPDRLRDTVDKFTAFLEDLAKQQNLTTDVKIFLALGFTSLDKPSRAVDLLKKIPKPAAARAEDEKAQAEVRTYGYVQLLTARSLRAVAFAMPATSKEEIAEREKVFVEAKSWVDAMVGNPQAKGWAFTNLEVRREYMFLNEDSGRFVDAHNAWRQNQQPFLKQMQDRMLELEALKRVTVDEVAKDVETIKKRVPAADRSVLDEKADWINRTVVKLKYDAGLKEIEKLKIEDKPASPGVQFGLQKMLFLAKLKQQAQFEEELAALPEKQKWLQENFVAKDVRLSDGLNRIETAVKESTEQTLLKTMLTMAKLKIKPQLDQTFQRYRKIVYEYHYYILRCVYLSKARSAALAKDEAKKKAEYRKVAANIVKVEKDPQTADFGGDEVRKLYRELLDGDDLLRTSYVEEGGAALVSPGAAVGMP